MDFVDDINLVSAELGRILYRIPKVAHLIHAVVAGSVDFDDIQAFVILHPDTVRTFAARISVIRMFTVDGPCKDFSRGSFAGSPRTAEKICVGDPVVHDLVPQGLNHSFLADHMGEIPGPPLSVQGAVRHIIPRFHRTH